jgi:hypothetical protein
MKRTPLNPATVSNHISEDMGHLCTKADLINAVKHYRAEVDVIRGEFEALRNDCQIKALEFATDIIKRTL